MRKPVLRQEFKNLTSSQLSVFVKQEAVRRGLKLSPQLITALVSLYQSDTWGLVTELDKLAAGGRLEAVLPEVNLFQQLWQINRVRSTEVRLPILERLIIQDDSAKIFNLLAYQARGRNKQKLADYDVAVKSGQLDYETALLDFLII